MTNEQEETGMSVRWGIMGTANIAKKVVRAIDLADGAKVTAVASRSKDRAAEWAKAHDVPKCYGSYDALLEDPDIDAVYIPLPPSMHAEWTVKAARAGKHVLCEKPLAPTAADASEMVEACRAAGVQLMDGVMWVHHVRACEIRNRLAAGEIGELRRVASAFTFNWGPEIPTDNIRARHDLGGGALGDLGYYCVRAVLWAFGGVPERVFGTARRANDVDIEFSGLLLYSNDRTASIDCGFTMNGRMWVEVAGSDAAVSVEDFVVPVSEEESVYRIGSRHGQKSAYSVGPCVQEAEMIRTFSNIVQSGSIDPQPAIDALDTVRICDALRRSAAAGTPQALQ